MVNSNFTIQWLLQNFTNLFISKGIVEAHGGDLAKNNVDRIGTTFSFIFPVM